MIVNILEEFVPSLEALFKWFCEASISFSNIVIVSRLFLACKESQRDVESSKFVFLSSILSMFCYRGPRSFTFEFKLASSCAIEFGISFTIYELCVFSLVDEIETRLRDPGLCALPSNWTNFLRASTNRARELPFFFVYIALFRK